MPELGCFTIIHCHHPWQAKLCRIPLIDSPVQIDEATSCPPKDAKAGRIYKDMYVSVMGFCPAPTLVSAFYLVPGKPVNVGAYQTHGRLLAG